MLQGSFRNWDDATDSAPSVRIDEATSTITYVGGAVANASEAAAVWRIKKLTCGVVFKMEWADSNTDFDNIWANRESLTYS